MSYIKPTVPGAALVASDSNALAEIPPEGITIGSKCWNMDVGAYFTLTESTASLVPDEIVEVFGLTGVRWIVAASGTGTVESVTAETSNAIDNTDPANPVIQNASASNAGTLSATDKTKLDITHPLAEGASLTDSDQTVNPGSTIGQFTMAAGTTTTDRIVTVGNTGAVNGLAAWINIYAQANGVTIKNAAGSTLFTVTAGKAYRVGVYYGGVNYGLNYAEVLA